MGGLIGRGGGGLNGWVGRTVEVHVLLGLFAVGDVLIPILGWVGGWVGGLVSILLHLSLLSSSCKVGLVVWVGG